MMPQKLLYSKKRKEGSQVLLKSTIITSRIYTKTTTVDLCQENGTGYRQKQTTAGEGEVLVGYSDVLGLHMSHRRVKRLRCAGGDYPLLLHGNNRREERNAIARNV
jgi:hypothetical protein